MGAVRSRALKLAAIWRDAIGGLRHPDPGRLPPPDRCTEEMPETSGSLICDRCHCANTLTSAAHDKLRPIRGAALER
jgi:hypothetical protein